MGLVPVEKTFPRGGQVEPPRDLSTKRQHHIKTPNLFGGKNLPPKQQKEVARNKDGSKKTTAPFLRLRQYVGQLTYKTITEGMLVLGSISRIEKFQMIVTLPGNATGTIPITNISEAYSTALNCEDICPYQLADMFRIGQHVITRVVRKETVKDNRVRIVLSMAPECVYSNVSQSDVVEDSIFIAAVKSIEEKGFVMDLGIKNTTAFLKQSNAEKFEEVWNSGQSLGIGQLVPCVVKKAIKDKESTIATLTANPKRVANTTNNSTGATLETLIPGMTFNVTVSVKFPTGLQVRLSDNFVGYVHQDHFSAPFKTPDNYEIGTIIPAKVLYIMESGAVYFTLKSNILESKPRRLPFDKIQIGDIVGKAVVISINDNGYWVTVGKTDTDPLKGFIPLTQTAFTRNTGDDEYDVPLSQQLANDHPIGSEIKCRIINYNYMDQYYICTLDKTMMAEKYIHVNMLKLGLVIQSFIKDINPKGMNLALGKKSRLRAFVPLIHVSDVPLTRPEKKFKIGQPCQAKVLCLKDGHIVCTMKPTLVKSQEPMCTSYEEAELDVRYDGTVVFINDKGLLVEFYDNTTGWVPTRSLHTLNQTPEAIAKNFFVGQVIRCTVIKKNEEKQWLTLNTIDFSKKIKKKEDKVIKILKKEMLAAKSVESGTLPASKLTQTNGIQKENMKSVKKKKTKAGDPAHTETIPLTKKMMKKLALMNKAPNSLSEVTLVRTQLDANKTVSQLRRERRKDLKIIHKQTEVVAGQPKPFSQLDMPAIQTKLNGISLDSNSREKRKKTVSTSSADGASPEKIAAWSEDNPDTSKVRPVKSKATRVKTETVELPRLSVSTGFVWDATPDLLPVSAKVKDESESSDEDMEQPGKKVKKTRQAAIAEKRALAQEEEARLRRIEQRLMDAEQPPQSSDEFDRLVLSSPDSSMVWLQYMAHHLQATEIEKARNVAQRALKSISFREEQERLNVWVALLNLENLYGTKESLELTLEEAVRVNDAYLVYTQMLQIYGDSHKLQEGDKLIGVMTKKFKSHKDTWFNAALFYMKSAQMEKARSLLQRALANLDKKEHVLVISQFAQLENKMGSTERAQTLMEQILTTYPKRVDVWSAYVDMLVKSNLIQMARQVLERAVVQKLPSHKMKVLFKKFLSFEEAQGNEDGANKVRQMALEYVESAAGAALQ